jgi:hypothetical protein
MVSSTGGLARDARFANIPELVWAESFYSMSQLNEEM